MFFSSRAEDVDVYEVHCMYILGFFPFFKFILHFLDVKASGSCKEGICMVAGTASSLEILLNPTHKCI